MSGEGGGDAGTPDNGIQVCVRVRPLNSRERDEGHRICASFDEPTKQVVLEAVDKNTLLQLRGMNAKGYAFDRRFGQDDTSDTIYEACVAQLVENIFKGYNGTVLAYGQTGSGKTHTMSGGVGIHGRGEEGITPRVIRHLFLIVDAIKKKQKPGEKIMVTAYGLELYNEELRDLASMSTEAKAAAGAVAPGWDGVKSGSTGLKLQERPIGKEGRVVPEVVGVVEREVVSAEDLKRFYDDVMENRSVSSTKLNDRSSRSHAIFTITIHRTIVEVMNELGDDLRARVRTTEFVSKLHLVDLAGSERVKRSGVTGKELKEATHINSGLLALGNVIVALANEGEGKKKGHVPYRDSKLTRLLQDSLGGNSLTVLISCISPSEMDFEETNNTLKYANRACSIKNTPLPTKFSCVEEDLLPMLPQAGSQSLGFAQLQALLENHEAMREARERRERERQLKDAKRNAELMAMRESLTKKPGFQRLRATQYDELRRQLASRNTNIGQQVVADDTLKGFGRLRMTQSVEGPLMAHTARSTRSARPRMESGLDSPGVTPRRHGPSSASKSGASGGDLSAWLQAQAKSESGDHDSTFAEENDFYHSHGDGEEHEFIAEDDEPMVFEDEEEDIIASAPDDNVAAALEPWESEAGTAAAAGAADAAGAAAKASSQSKSKFGKRTAALRAVPVVDSDGGADDSAAQSVTDAPLSQSQSQQGLLDVDGTGVDSGAEALEGEPYDPIHDHETPRLLARFKVNTYDTLSVFKAVSKEDFKDVIGLLPENTPLPASDKMTYLLARLEVNPSRDIASSLTRVMVGEATMNDAVGPAVGCLMATFGTNMIASCIFDFEDPAELRFYSVDERIELWGLQIPHNSARPTLAPEDGTSPSEAGADEPAKEVITWSSVDRLNMSIGLLYALCNHAAENGIRCGFCVPRPQLLKRWMQAGVKMEQIRTPLKLIYPPSAHDYEYYKASTVAWFMVHEVKLKLEQVLGIVRQL